MRGDPERNMNKQTVRGRRQPYTLPIPQEKTQEPKPKEKEISNEKVGMLQK